MTLALVERQEERLTPLERLEALADPGSLRLIRTQVRSRTIGDQALPGDGVLAGHAIAVVCDGGDFQFGVHASEHARGDGKAADDELLFRIDETTRTMLRGKNRSARDVAQAGVLLDREVDQVVDAGEGVHGSSE